MNGKLQVVLIVVALSASRAYPHKDTSSEVEAPLDEPAYHYRDAPHDTVKVKRRTINDGHKDLLYGLGRLGLSEQYNEIDIDDDSWNTAKRDDDRLNEAETLEEEDYGETPTIANDYVTTNEPTTTESVYEREDTAEAVDSDSAFEQLKTLIDLVKFVKENTVSEVNDEVPDNDDQDIKEEDDKTGSDETPKDSDETSVTETVYDSDLNNIKMLIGLVKLIKDNTDSEVNDEVPQSDSDEQDIEEADAKIDSEESSKDCDEIDDTKEHSERNFNCHDCHHNHREDTFEIRYPHPTYPYYNFAYHHHPYPQPPYNDYSMHHQYPHFRPFVRHPPFYPYSSFPPGMFY